MNANIKKVDELMKNRNIKFSVACKAYKLIRRGVSVDAALVIANAREGKELLKQQQKDNGMKKSKCEKSLEQLIKELKKKADDRVFVNICGFLPKSERFSPDGHYSKVIELLILDDLTPATDALNYIDHEASTELNNAKIGKDALDLCYSNTDGAEVLF